MAKPRKYRLYVIGARNSGPYKIGYAKDYKARLNDIQVGNPKKLFAHFTVSFDSKQTVVAAERNIHLIFEKYHVRGEWYDVNLINIGLELFRIYSLSGYQLYMDDLPVPKESSFFQKLLNLHNPWDVELF